MREHHRESRLASNSLNCFTYLNAAAVDLCILFHWAQFRGRTSAVRLHTLLDLRGSIPAVVVTG
jgi:hypothetical protein